ncbi:MAG: response regulator [Selenomonadaceae bacterium]|nr:response regulator [Selenomonadaceae bacterium]
MKRVLIVDDDFLVRTYLKQMIPWEEQGFYIIGDAKNGREALEILQRDGADILIADVSMPIMDGIELTRHAKKLSPRTHILILSCHDDFVYVKEAMKLGIDDYLLKNDLSEETLLDALKKISFDAEENSEMERLALIGRKKLREDFFRAFDAGEPDKLERLAADAEISAAFGAAAAFMIIPQRWQEREQILSENERENFLAAFAEMTSNTCRNLLGEKIQPMIFDSTRGGFFHWGLLVEGGTREIAERLRNFSKLYFNLELKIFFVAAEKKSRRTVGAVAENFRRPRRFILLGRKNFFGGEFAAAVDKNFRRAEKFGARGRRGFELHRRGLCGRTEKFPRKTFARRTSSGNFVDVRRGALRRGGTEFVAEPAAGGKFFGVVHALGKIFERAARTPR